MGQKDISEKILLAYNDVFADILNGLLFDGQEIVTPDSLTDLSETAFYKADTTELHQMERDVVKQWNDRSVNFAIYGIENQSAEDRLMPARIIGYDGASYRAQMSDRERFPILSPVLTIVLYFGEDHWTGPRTLKEILQVPDVIDPYVNDYRIHVFEISWLTDEQLARFKSDFGIVANFFVKKRRDPNYVPDDEREIEHVDAVLKVLSVFTQDESYVKAPKGSEKGVKTMCEVAQRLINQGRSEGRTQGWNEGMKEAQRKSEEQAKQYQKEIDEMKAEIQRLKEQLNQVGA